MKKVTRSCADQEEILPGLEGQVGDFDEADVPQAVLTDSCSSSSSSSGEEEEPLEASVKLSLSRENSILKKVQFNTVTVHYHSITLGDCPWVKRGPPIALSDHIQSKEYSNLEHYETTMRSTKPPGPRRKEDREIRRLTCQQRLMLLRRAGVAEEDIVSRSKETHMMRLEMLKENPKLKTLAKKKSSENSQQPNVIVVENCENNILMTCSDDPVNDPTRTKSKYPLTCQEETAYWFDWICDPRRTQMHRTV